MPGKVYNRVEELMARKKRDDPHMPTSYRDVGEILDMSPTTVGAWVNNRIKRYDGEKLAAWCDFLECELSELLVYERDGKPL